MTRAALTRAQRASVLEALRRPTCDRCGRFATELFYAEDADIRAHPGEDGMVCLSCRTKIERARS